MTDNKSNGGFLEDHEDIFEKEDFDPEEKEKWLEFYGAIEGMTGETPDGRMPIESREFLGSIWDDVLAFMDKQNREFSEGNIMLNFQQFKKFRDGYLFAKELEKAGLVSDVRCEYRERRKQPSDVLFHTERLDLKGELKDRFADIAEGSCVIDVTGKTSGGMDVKLRFSKIWIPIPEKIF